MNSRLVRKVSVLLSWKHLMIRCGSQTCPLRLKTQPAVLARFHGIRFQNRWYHQTDCLKEALEVAVKQLLPSTSARRQRGHRLPLGLLLVKRGAITAEELREGLRLQRLAGTGKLGFWLQQFTSLGEGQICAALGQQWGCPVFPLERHTALQITGDVPYPLLAAAKAVPVFTSIDGQQRHIAFSERIDYSLLRALEEILGCHTFPCVARESEISQALEEFRKRSAGDEISFDTIRDPREIAATICSYAAQMDIREVKVVPLGGYLWVAFFRKGIRRDLLFRVSQTSAVCLRVFDLPEIQAFPEIADVRRDGVLGAAGPL